MWSKNLFIFISVIFLCSTSGYSGIMETKHNLSVTGPGEIKSTTETEVCVFCHVPHNSYPQTPLWGHALSAVTNYRIFTSKGAVTTKGRTFIQPDGASRLCLSCHDGTVALGAVLGSREIKFASGQEYLKEGMKGFIGTDLSGSHPVSIPVSDSEVSEKNQRKLSILRSVKDMKSDPDGVVLDRENKVQCTTCHDPHNDVNFNSSGIHFWRKKDFSSVCEVCHGM